MITNHYGIWIDSEIPITGVASNNNIAWEFVDDEICLTCEESYDEIENDDSLDEDEKQNEYDSLECDSQHTKIFGDWIQDTKNGQIS